MYRQYARSKRGKRVNIRISGKRHARIGLVAAQRESALLAPHTYSGTMKASVFEDWFENKLLSCLPKGHVIIMDNAAFHKKEVLQNLARKYSQKLIFLLNPPKKKREFFYEKKKPKNCTTCKVIAYSASVLDFNSVQAL